MTADRSSYEELAAQRRDSGGYREGYAEARRAFLIGQAVRERRLALGLSQAELAARAGITQPALSRAGRRRSRAHDPTARADRLRLSMRNVLNADERTLSAD